MVAQGEQGRRFCPGRSHPVGGGLVACRGTLHYLLLSIHSIPPRRLF